ncbi:MAG: OmpA family protein [Cytophagales bacterium]|nr:OmpA family protein [Cytophagales bacterium]
MKKSGLILLVLFFSNLLNAQLPTKVEKLKKRADHQFEQMHFLKAVAGYKEVLKYEKMPAIELRLADSYRLLNQPMEAAFWYSRAITDGADLSKENLLNYALMLSASERYQEAKSIFVEHGSSDPWVQDHVTAIDSFANFYKDQHAYKVSWESFNSSEKDFSPSFVNGELVFVSARATRSTSGTFQWDGTSFLDLFKRMDESQVTRLKGSINSKYHEGPATFWDKGTKAFFTRNSFDGTKVKLSEDGVNNLRIFYAELSKSGQWVVKSEFPFNSEKYSMGHPSISGDGKTLYFASDMPGGFGGVDLYKSEYKYNQWETPVNLGPEINTPRNELFPYIHTDGLLYFASEGHEGIGGLDLFRASMSEESEPQNLGFPINTSADDFGLTFRPKSNQAYFSSNRPGGMGDDDIYSVHMSDYAVEVVLVDELTGEPISTTGRIDLLRTLRSQMNSPGISIAETRLQFGVERGTSFLVTGSADGYYQGNLIMQLEDEQFERVKHLYYEIPLRRTNIQQQTEILIVVNNDRHTQFFYSKNGRTTPFDGTLGVLRTFLNMEGYTVVKETYLTNIFYDFDRSDIRADAAESLEELAQILKTDESLHIILESHTDVRGTNQYNQLLAKRRVDAAQQFLMDLGINVDRIYTGSHGEEQTFVNCNDCSEDQHQRNRRTEIRIEINKVKQNKRLTSINR